MSDILVTDSQGIVIGSANVEMVSDGAVIHIDIPDGHGMAIVRSMTEGTFAGMSIRPVIPPVIEATTVDR